MYMPEFVTTEGGGEHSHADINDEVLSLHSIWKLGEGC